MKSPRFDVRAKKLQDIFSKKNIVDIWKNKVRNFMKDQIAGDGIENFDYHVYIDIEAKKLSNLILSGEYYPQKAQRLLLEKSKGLCRQIVIPTPRDCIILQCLSDALYKEISGKAPSPNSFYQPQDHSLSTQGGYGTLASWINFQRKLFNFSKTRKFIVVTDVANYYDSISYSHLRNSISSITSADECILDMLIYILSDLLWQPDYTPRVEVGLPQIDLDAPRLLAHCFLYELDAFLASDPSRDFVRFMDDIDIGVDSIVEAKQVLKSVDLVLQTKQTRLNSGKTIILSRADALRHFRVFENARIDTVKESINRKIKVGSPIDRERRLVTSRISKGMKKNSFDTGNGEKILKRWINLAAATESKIDPDLIEKLVKIRPAVRTTIYSYIRSQPLRPTIAAALARAATSGFIVDDAGHVELANHLVETFVRTRNCEGEIQSIIQEYNIHNYYGLYCKLWLQSKYSKPEDVLETIRDSGGFWASHERLGRLVGSLSPLFEGTSHQDAYRKTVYRTLNAGVRETFKFHEQLKINRDIYKKLFPALSSPNTSRGTHITHAKFLLLLSAMQNKTAQKAELTKLLNNNSRAFSDCYYKTIARRIGVI